MAALVHVYWIYAEAEREKQKRCRWALLSKAGLANQGQWVMFLACPYMSFQGRGTREGQASPMAEVYQRRTAAIYWRVEGARAWVADALVVQDAAAEPRAVEY